LRQHAAVTKQLTNEFDKVFWIVTIILLFILGGWTGDNISSIMDHENIFCSSDSNKITGGNVFKLYVLAIKSQKEIGGEFSDSTGGKSRPNSTSVKPLCKTK
jgi:hypothetical protein